MENKLEDDYLDRYVKKVGFIRNKNPKSIKKIALDNLKLYVNFGDLSSSIVFGNIISPRYFNENIYNIVLTWKGMGHLFPTADETWCLDKGYALGDFYSRALSLNNDSSNLQIIIRSLNEHFLGVMDVKSHSKYYNFTLTNEFYKDFPNFLQKQYELLPLIYLSTEFRNKILQNRSKKCFIMPCRHSKHIERGSTSLLLIDQNYYINLLKRLEDYGFQVFCIQNDLTYDLSTSIFSENVVHVREDNYLKIISMINHVGNYFDFFTDTGALGLLGKVPVFRAIDRSYYSTTKKYVEDKIINFGYIIKNYFSFLYFAKRDTDLNNKFFDHIIDQFDQFFKSLSEQKIEDRTVLLEKEVNLATISKMYVKKLSPKFISVCKEKKHE